LSLKINKPNRERELLNLGVRAGGDSNVLPGFVSLIEKLFMIAAWAWMLIKTLGAD